MFPAYLVGFADFARHSEALTVPNFGIGFVILHFGLLSRHQNPCQHNLCSAMNCPNLITTNRGSLSLIFVCFWRRIVNLKAPLCFHLSRCQLPIFYLCFRNSLA